jgi:hypothetical protein
VTGKKRRPSGEARADIEADGEMTMPTHAFSSVLQIPTDTKRRSVLRRFIDAVIEGRQRKAVQQVAIFLEHHKHSLRDDLRAELQRRLLDACKPGLGMGSNRKEDRRRT